MASMGAHQRATVTVQTAYETTRFDSPAQQRAEGSADMAGRDAGIISTWGVVGGECHPLVVKA